MVYFQTKNALREPCNLRMTFKLNQKRSYLVIFFIPIINSYSSMPNFYVSNKVFRFRQSLAHSIIIIHFKYDLIRQTRKNSSKLNQPIAVCKYEKWNKTIHFPKSINIRYDRNEIYKKRSIHRGRICNTLLQIFALTETEHFQQRQLECQGQERGGGGKRRLSSIMFDIPVLLATMRAPRQWVVCGRVAGDILCVFKVSRKQQTA